MSTSRCNVTLKSRQLSGDKSREYHIPQAFSEHWAKVWFTRTHTQPVIQDRSLIDFVSLSGLKFTPFNLNRMEWREDWQSMDHILEIGSALHSSHGLIRTMRESNNKVIIKQTTFCVHFDDVQSNYSLLLIFRFVLFLVKNVIKCFFLVLRRMKYKKSSSSIEKVTENH